MYIGGTAVEWQEWLIAIDDNLNNNVLFFYCALFIKLFEMRTA